MKQIKRQAQYIPLRRRFTLYLLSHHIKEFSTKEAYEWYGKEARKDVTYGNMYVVLLKPLLFEGKIGRVGRGLWTVTIPDSDFDISLLEQAEITQPELDQEDEWERHIREKLYTPDLMRGLKNKEEGSDG